MSFEEDARRVKQAARGLSHLSSEKKNELLTLFADGLSAFSANIIAENNVDVEAAKQAGIATTMLDRLRLTPARIQGMVDGIREVIALDDPIGVLLEKKTVSAGIAIEKVSVPLGVIGIIYEARPNVTADSIALAIKSGNACILKGGKEAIRSNIAIVAAFKEAVIELNLDPDYVLLVEDTTRETTNQLMRANGLVDVLIPRGGSGLIATVVANASVPVIETGAGNCHVYVEKSADLNMACAIIDNAKTQRPSVCNAAETLLVDSDVAAEFLPLAFGVLSAKGVELRGDARTIEILGDKVIPATDEDYKTEYNDLILAVKAVSGVEEAVDHINAYSTSHSEAIITNNSNAAEYFLENTDSAAVYVNASTRFTDGGVFGLGAEIGISTQKLHARGPMGLKELTSYKYKVRGHGEIRE
jgi:glutamate-5-semialdehyde dehydrogenase